MSFARFGWDGSDVYLFPTADGYECCACPLGDLPEGRAFRTAFTTDNVEAFLAHMHEHRAVGQCVPDYAFEGLRDWIVEVGA